VTIEVLFYTLKRNSYTSVAWFPICPLPAWQPRKNSRTVQKDCSIIQKIDPWAFMCRKMKTPLPGAPAAEAMRHDLGKSSYCCLSATSGQCI